MRVNRLYRYAREFFKSGKINWSRDGGQKFYCLAVNDIYEPDFSGNFCVSDIPQNAINARCELQIIDSPYGVLDADDVSFVFDNLRGKHLTEAVIICQDNGGASKDVLLMYIGLGDRFGHRGALGGLPVFGDFDILWDNGPLKIVDLGKEMQIFLEKERKRHAVLHGD